MHWRYHVYASATFALVIDSRQLRLGPCGEAIECCDVGSQLLPFVYFRTAITLNAFELATGPS